jgi:hypothetical protein
MRKAYFSLYEIAVLSLLGALVFILRTALRMPLRIPGHTGIFWVVPVILGVGIVRKLGAGSYVGLISGLLASFFGFGGFHVFDLFKYLMLGVTIDLLAVPFAEHLDKPAVGLILGAAGNLSKMVVNYYVHILLGVPAIFIMLGIGFASVSHFIFGGLGGIISALLLARLYKSGVIKKKNAGNSGG